MHKEDTFEDPAPDSEEFKSHVICQHNKLQPNHKKRRLISEGVCIFSYRYEKFARADQNFL